MRSLEELLNLVSRYLTGPFSQEERAEFELGMRAHPVLRREVEELGELRTALDAADELEELHLANDLITKWVFAQGDLTDSDKSRIIEHTALCRHCREALELARDSHRLLSQPDESLLAGFLTGLKHWWEQLTMPRFALSPALTAFVLLVLAIPAYFGVRDIWQSDAGMQKHQVQRLGTRAGEPVELVEIRDNQDLLELSILLPVQDSAVYTFQLLTPEGAAIYRLERLAPGEPMAVAIPTIYLESAEYILQFDEVLVGDSISTIISRFPLAILRK